MLYDRKEAYSKAKEYVQQGKIVGIFPEGKLGSNCIKIGAIRLALDTKTPILPIHIDYLSKSLAIKELYRAKRNVNYRKQMLEILSKNQKV